MPRWDRPDFMTTDRLEAELWNAIMEEGSESADDYDDTITSQRLVLWRASPCGSVTARIRGASQTVGFRSGCQ